MPTPEKTSDIFNFFRSLSIGFNDYQVATNCTAVFPEIDAAVAEETVAIAITTATLAGKVKKIYRDKGGELSDKDKLSLMAMSQQIIADVQWLQCTLDECPEKPGRSNSKTMYVRLGLVNEVGEILEKESSGKLDNIGQELGDVLWYLVQLMSALGLQLSTVAYENVMKLFTRKIKGTLKGDGDNR